MDPIGDGKQPVKCALKMRGLPYSVNDQEIVQFFHGLGLVEDSVRIGKMNNGKLTGEACVLFEQPEDARMALNAKQKQYLGQRYVELFSVTAEEHQNFEVQQQQKFENRTP